MRQLNTLILFLSFLFFANPIVTVHADEIDNMVEALNKEFRENDDDGFAAKFTEYSTDSNRFSSTDYVDLGKKSGAFVSRVLVFGDYLSHSNLKRRWCGDRIVKIISVFFATEGQYAISYLFLKPKDSWRLASFDMEGQSGPKAFMDKLSKMTENSC